MSTPEVIYTPYFKGKPLEIKHPAQLDIGLIATLITDPSLRDALRNGLRQGRTFLLKPMKRDW